MPKKELTTPTVTEPTEGSNVGAVEITSLAEIYFRDGTMKQVINFLGFEVVTETDTLAFYKDTTKQKGAFYKYSLVDYFVVV